MSGGMARNALPINLKADWRSGRRSCELRTGASKRVTSLDSMRIPRRVDYGLRALIYLSVQDPGKYCSIAMIAKQQGVPKKFLEKIIQDLVRCGLIKSQRGACGGYTLGRSPEQISFYDVIEALEVPIAVKRTNRNGRRP